MIYAWEIIRIIPDIKDNTKQMRCSMIIAASTIEEVWEYLAFDRSDSKTEIESIIRFGPIVATIPLPKQ